MIRNVYSAFALLESCLARAFPAFETQSAAHSVRLQRPSILTLHRPECEATAASRHQHPLNRLRGGSRHAAVDPDNSPACARTPAPPQRPNSTTKTKGLGRAACSRCSSPSSGVSQTCQRRQSFSPPSSGRTGLALLNWLVSHQSGGRSQKPWSSQSPRCSKCHHRHGGHLLRPHRDCTCVQPQEPPGNYLCLALGSQCTRIH